MHRGERMDSSDCTITTSRTSARNLTVIPISLTIDRVIHFVVPFYLSFFFTQPLAPHRGSTEKMYLRGRSDYFVDFGLETVHADGHLWRIEGVLHHCICICFVNLLQSCVCAGVCYGSEQDKFSPCSESMLGGWKRNDGGSSPVTVRKMFTLNVSASMTCTPELGPVGERRVVIA